MAIEVIGDTMKREAKARFRLFRGQAGISLLEVLVVVGILGFIGTGVVMAIDTNARAGRTLDEQVTATNLATAYIEAIRALPYADTYDNIGDNIIVPSQYSVNIDLSFTSDGDTWVDDPSGKTLQRITVIVSREGGNPVLSVCTYKTEK